MKLELRLHCEPLVDSIFRGEFALGALTLDQMVDICNVAANKLTVDPESEMVMGDEINNLALWLGGIDKDIQVYAWQLIRRVKHLDVAADDKTSVRLQPLEEKIFSGEPYAAEDYKSITHFAWPKVFTEGDFESRLEELPEAKALMEELSNIPSANQIITGTDEPVEGDIDLNIQYAVMTGIAYALQETWEKYGKKPNILMDEQMMRSARWLSENTTLEIQVMFWRSVLGIYHMNAKNSEALMALIPEEVKGMILKDY